MGTGQPTCATYLPPRRPAAAISAVGAASPVSRPSGVPATTSTTSLQRGKTRANNCTKRLPAASIPPWPALTAGTITGCDDCGSYSGWGGRRACQQEPQKQPQGAQTKRLSPPPQATDAHHHGDAPTITSLGPVRWVKGRQDGVAGGRLPASQDVCHHHHHRFWAVGIKP